MKNLVSFVFLLALLVSGCSQDEVLLNGTSASGEGRTFITSFENNESRTYLEDGRLSRWTEGDRISLFDANTLNSQYVFAGETGDSGGTFFMLSKPEGTGTALEANYAVYPYDKDMTISEYGLINVTLPSTQHYAENSYGLGDNTMVAETYDVDDTFLQFKNVGGCFKFQLYGDDVTVKSITLMGNNDEKIAGKAYINPNYYREPEVSMSEDATNFITLDCGDKGVRIGTSADNATAFWMVLPPVTFKKGITILVTDVDGKEFIQTTDKQLEIERNVVKPMVAVKARMEPKSSKLLYTTDTEVLDEWSEGLFCNDGIYYLAKPAGENSCLVTLGNLMTDENCTFFIDDNRQVREIFFDDNIFTFNNYTENSVDISFFDENGTRHTETVARNLGPVSRSSGEHGQQADGINLGLNMVAIKDAVSDIAQKETAYKYGRGWQSYVLNVFNAFGSAFELGGGSENAFFSNKFVDVVGTLDNLYGTGEMGLALYNSLKLKDVKLKLGPGGPAVWAAMAWLGFYTTYLELFDEHIQAYYGNTIASIGNIKYEDNELKIDLNVSNYENIYNLDYGVIVRKSISPFLTLPVGVFPAGTEVKTVIQNGNYSFSVSGIEEGEAYDCYPFLISKSRDPLWIGFIGEMAGPFVKYGKAKKFTPAKKIKRLAMYENEEQFTRYTFYYKNDTISSITGTDDGGVTYSFDYIDNKTINVIASYEGEYEAFYLKLNEDGYIKSCSQSYHGEGYWYSSWNFEYNEDGQLVYVSSSRRNESWRISYKDSNAVSVSGTESRSISYGNLEGQGYWILHDWMCGVEVDDQMELFGLLGLLGKPSKNLPSVMSGDDYPIYYNWSLDDEGYPNRLSVDGIVMNFSWE